MKFRSVFLFVCVFIAYLFLTAFVHDVGASDPMKREIIRYTLEESIAEALANFSAIKVKKEAVEEAGAARKKARADFLPELSTSYGYHWVETPPRLKNLNVGGMEIAKWEYGTEDNYEWKVTLKQPLFTGFALVSAYNLAKLGIDVSKLELELEILDLILRVNHAYFGILRTDKYLDVTERAVEQLQSVVDEAQDFFDAGIIPINDLLKSEVELVNAKHDLIKAQNATKLSRSAFNTVLSRPVNEPVDVSDVMGYQPVVPDLDACFEKAGETRPEIRILDIKILQMEQAIRLARSGYYPKVGVAFDYVNAGDEPDVSGSDFHVSSNWQAMAGLSWSLWQWGKTHYSISAEKSRKRQLIDAKSGIEDNVRLDVKKAVLHLDEAAKNIPTTKKGVEQAEENMRVSRERYQSQLTTSTEVLDAQTLLTQARLNYYNSLYDYHVAQARLQRAIGER